MPGCGGHNTLRDLPTVGSGALNAEMLVRLQLPQLGIEGNHRDWSGAEPEQSGPDPHRSPIRPSGPARSGRHTVNVESGGSNPLWDAQTRGGKSAKRPVSNTGRCGFESHPRDCGEAWGASPNRWKTDRVVELVDARLSEGRARKGVEVRVFSRSLMLSVGWLRTASLRGVRGGVGVSRSTRAPGVPRRLSAAERETRRPP